MSILTFTFYTFLVLFSQAIFEVYSQQNFDILLLNARSSYSFPIHVSKSGDDFTINIRDTVRTNKIDAQIGIGTPTDSGERYYDTIYVASLCELLNGKDRDGGQVPAVYVEFAHMLLPDIGDDDCTLKKDTTMKMQKKSEVNGDLKDYRYLKKDDCAYLDLDLAKNENSDSRMLAEFRVCKAMS